MHDHRHDHHHHHEHDHGPREPIDWGGLWSRYRPVWIALIVLVVLWRTFFVVRETEFVLVTRFGAPVRSVVEAGLNVKWPFESANYFDRRLRVYNPTRSEFLTRDKKNLVIESYVLWRIADPERFVQAVGTAEAAEMRLHDVTWAGLAAEVGRHDLEDLVSPDPKKREARKMLDRLSEATGSRALEQYGVDVLDVRIKRLNLPEQNKQSVYARMRAERERIARRHGLEALAVLAAVTAFAVALVLLA